MEPQPAIASLGHHAGKYTGGEQDATAALVAAFEDSPATLLQRLAAFPRHVRRQDLARFLVKYELFKLALPVHGSVVELGVHLGGGLFCWYHCSAIMEPYNHNRRVIGFDTFAGFPAVREQDRRTGRSEHLTAGGLKTYDSILDELRRLAAAHDRNRPLGHVPKVELVAGDVAHTIDEYLRANPHLLVSLMYLDFDLYEPTKVALERLLPRVVKGGVVAFDELNCGEFPGETTALLESLDLSRVGLRRFPMDPHIAYFIKD
jgi:hypothetical protein